MNWPTLYAAVWISVYALLCIARVLDDNFPTGKGGARTQHWLLLLLAAIWPLLILKSLTFPTRKETK